MKTTRTPQPLVLALICAATLLGASACGTTGTGTATPSATATQPAATTASPTTTMDPSTGASPTGSSMGSTGTAAETTIHIKSFAYTGPDSVPGGATVTVMNMDTVAHTLTADDGSFDAVVKPGTSATFTAPAKPGTYTYHCTYHSNMHGTLNVK
ncbi:MULTISPECIES: cupredoxin domain-containing protein [unclassified Arthrobacter]|uniref:cupredoxin domain-containing protein n=1 Tax=unclassified Arthrobacter TaxID=235627 RepID=UPI0033943212